MPIDDTSPTSTMSPLDLKLYKYQLRQREKDMSPQDLDSVFARTQGVPEPEPRVEPLKAFEAPPPEMEAWQKGLHWLTSPLQWVQEEVFTPIAAAALSWATPSVEGTEGMDWMQRELQEWKQWEEPTWTMPWGAEFKPIKGIAETLPWFAIPGIGWVGKGALAGKGIAGALGRLAPRAGKLAPIVRGAGRALEYSPYGLAEKGLGKAATVAGKGIKKVLPKAAQPAELFSVPANEALEKLITKDDWMRRVAQWFGRKPVFKEITEAVGGKAATVKGTMGVEDVTARALLVGQRVRETVLNSRAVALAELRNIHSDPVRLFGIDEATGIAKGIRAKSEFSGASKVIYDIAEHPNKYILTPMQSAYIKEIHYTEDLVLKALQREGVNVNLLKFDEFSHWVHRVVLGKRVDGKLVELTKGFGRVGSKQSFQKTRFYEVAADAVEKGTVYSPNIEQALDLYVQGAAKSISDQRIAGMVAQFGVKPIERLAVAPAKAARETAHTLAGANNLVKVINRAIRGEKLTEATLKAQERRFPQLGTSLRKGIGNKEELQKLLKDAKAVQEGAKAPYWKAKAERVKAMGIAKTPSLGTEATIAHPAFQGKIYPKGVADVINDYWADRGFAGFQKVATMSSTMRTLVAAADFSAMFIQGLPVIALHPKAWARGAAMSFQSFKNPQTYQRYLMKELPAIQERIYYGGYAGGFEYMEAMGALQRGAAKIAGRRGQQAVRQTYGRFEAAFGSFGDVARNEMWKGLRGRAKNADELFEIARHLDRMTGVMSMKGLGIGKTQRDFETGFLFFAPRYTRAGFALVGDMFKGGLTGAEAKKALGSMMAGGAAFYSGTCAALGQTPNFDPTSGRFMTIEITDPLTGTTRHFGIGGMMTSLVRFGADVVATTLDNPQDLIMPLKDGELNRYDNPFIKFMYSKAAPMTGFITGMTTGKNYFGEPFENAGDYAKFMVGQVTPIFAQEMLMEEGGMAPTTFMAEQVGMRTFPQADWEKRNVLRDKLSQQAYGMSWDELGTSRGKLYQMRLEQMSPELKESTEKAQEMSSKMARGEGKVWSAWHEDTKAIEEYYQKQMEMASEEYRQIADGYAFRKKVDEANAIRRAMYANMRGNPAYAEVYQHFEEALTPDQLAQMNPNDVARNTYYKLLFSPDMYDQYGNYNFDEADIREKQFTQQFGQRVLDYIEEYKGSKWAKPAPLMALDEARAILQPYWEIEARVWSQYPPELKQMADRIEILERTDPRQAKQLLIQNRQILFARNKIAREKKMLKLRNPEIAQALSLFY